MAKVASAAKVPTSPKGGAGRGDARFRSQFRKTELCAFFEQGWCSKGSRCEFAHGAGELQTAPDLTKTSLCRKWLKYRCRLTSEACPFAHGAQELRATEVYSNGSDERAAGSPMSQGKRSGGSPKKDKRVTPDLAAPTQEPFAPPLPALSPSNLERTGPAASRAAPAASSGSSTCVLVKPADQELYAAWGPPPPSSASWPSPEAGSRQPPPVPVAYPGGPSLHFGPPISAELKKPASASTEGAAGLAVPWSCADLMAMVSARATAGSLGSLEAMLQQASPEYYED